MCLQDPLTRKKDLIEVTHGIFTVSFLLASYFSSIFNDTLNAFSKNQIKQAAIIAIKMF